MASRAGLPLIRVQHHQAHVAACAAENNVEGPYVGVAWNGTGYGLDGTIWGGEFFRVENQRAGDNPYERIAHLRPFGLPGGDAAVREGWRSAAGVLFETFGPDVVASPARPMLERKINVVPTTSVGRLFDAVASITGLAQQNRFEGQAAILLENEIGSLRTEEAYPLTGGDWAPLVAEMLRDKQEGLLFSRIAARFHNALVNWILEVAIASGLNPIVLSGGVFQNRYLTERAATILESRGFVVHTHRHVPPNEGGIGLGQVVMA
jgi:hydrogenase maturation protein HypF